jgi:two-component system CheB/CheR fusion protein
VDDLLDVARISQGKLELHRARIDLGQVITRAIDMCRADIERRRQNLVVEGIDAEVPIDADAVRLTQVVSNLLHNACRYSEPEGRIWVRWGVDNECAFVRVTDEGCGIAPDFIGRMFGVFQQERGKGRGLGLGLALVRELVEKHGGVVEASSDGPGKGSEFVVRLPVTPGNLPDVDEPRREESPDARAPLRVVLIEDDADVHDVVGLLLEVWGHAVVGVAEEGKTGVELVTATRPDVAIVDIGLPDIDGYEVARRVHRALGRERPALLAMSGYGQAKDRELALEAGFDLHITKPPDPNYLRAALHTARRSQIEAGRDEREVALDEPRSHRPDA